MKFLGRRGRSETEPPAQKEPEIPTFDPRKKYQVLTAAGTIGSNVEDVSGRCVGCGAPTPNPFIPICGYCESGRNHLIEAEEHDTQTVSSISLIEELISTAQTETLEAMLGKRFKLKEADHILRQGSQHPFITADYLLAGKQVNIGIAIIETFGVIGSESRIQALTTGRYKPDTLFIGDRVSIGLLVLPGYADLYLGESTNIDMLAQEYYGDKAARVQYGNNSRVKRVAQIGGYIFEDTRYQMAHQRYDELNKRYGLDLKFETTANWQIPAPEAS